MITKLALKNILERKFRSLLAIFSISIGSGCLLLFLALSQGIETSTFNEIEKQKPLTQITVRPPAEEGSVLNFLSRNKEGQLNSSSIKEIEKIEGIKAIHPEIQFQNFASAQASIFGISLITDTMVFGLPEAFIADDLAPNQNWQATEEPYPVIIPRKILDLYNLTIALPQGLPSLQEEKLLNRQLTLYLNYSSFFPSKDGKKNAIKLKVAGFSDKTNLIGLSLPIELVKSFNQEFANSESETYLELFVETSDPALTTAVAEKIEALGYQTQYFHKNTQHIEEKLGFIRASLITISSIIFSKVYSKFKSIADSSFFVEPFRSRSSVGLKNFGSCTT